jgi:hypothetical protein
MNRSNSNPPIHEDIVSREPLDGRIGRAIEPSFEVSAAVAETETDAFITKEARSRSSKDEEDDHDNEIVSVAWEQLEERVISLEHILTKTNAKNYELNKRIEVLSAKRNLALGGKMELLVREAAVPLDPEGRKRRQGDMPLDVLQWTLSDETGQAEGQETLVRKEILLQQKYNDLSTRYHAHQDRIRQLEMVVETLAESGSEADTLVGSHGSYSKDSLKTEMSVLTDPDQTMSLGSSIHHDHEYGTGGGAETPIGTRHVEIDWIPQSEVKVDWVPPTALGTGDLGDILRAAATTDGLGRIRGSPLGASTPRKPKAATPMSPVASRDARLTQEDRESHVRDMENSALIPADLRGMEIPALVQQGRLSDWEEAGSVGEARTGYDHGAASI